LARSGVSDLTDLGTLLELVHDAERLSRTVAGGVLNARNGALYGEILSRRAERRGGGFAGLEHDPAQPQDTTQRVRFWLERPLRLREDVEGSGERRYATDGVTASLWTPEFDRVVPVEPEPSEFRDRGVSLLCEPSVLLGHLRLEIIGTAACAGRASIRALGHPRRRPRWADVFGFEPSADAYELLVDRERGVILRAGALVGDVEFASTEILDIEFDQPVPEHVFTLESAESTAGAAPTVAPPSPRRIDAGH
jgi:hypothetical protein